MFDMTNILIMPNRSDGIIKMANTNVTIEQDENDPMKIHVTEKIDCSFLSGKKFFIANREDFTEEEWDELCKLTEPFEEDI